MQERGARADLTDMRSVPRVRGIAADGRRSILLSAVMAALLLLLAVTGWAMSVVVNEPRLERGVLFARAVTDGHEAMLGQETGLRGHQLTADPSFLRPYRQGQADYLTQSSLAWQLVPSPGLQRLLLKAERSASRWQIEHAVPQLARTVPGRPGGRVAAEQGKLLFDAYRDDHETLLLAARAGNMRALHAGQLTSELVGGLQVLLALAALGATLLRRRSLRRDLVEPLHEVTDVLRRLAAGDASARTHRYDGVELDTLAAGVQALADAASARGADADVQRAAAASRAQVFQQVLGVAHELSGHLERHDLVCALLREVVQTARVDAARVHAVADGHADEELGARGTTDEVPLDVDGLARDAVRQLRVVLSEDGCSAALPLGHGGTVHAVLQVSARSPLDEDQVLALRSLALAAGGALTAAELHETVRAESRRDVLTGLYNRRRFEEDLQHELGLAGRTGGPISLVLLDVDHFKAFNDTFGHRDGDRVLRDVGGLLLANLRATDSAYRYGGEELAVVLRGTPADEAAQLAERLRGIIASRTPVTVSIGVVTTTTDLGADAVVEAADGALYAAKQGGRNRVERATSTESLLPLQRADA